GRSARATLACGGITRAARRTTVPSAVPGRSHIWTVERSAPQTDDVATARGSGEVRQYISPDGLPWSFASARPRDAVATAGTATRTGAERRLNPHVEAASATPRITNLPRNGSQDRVTTSVATKMSGASEATRTAVESCHRRRLSAIMNGTPRIRTRP